MRGKWEVRASRDGFSETAADIAGQRGEDVSDGEDEDERNLGALERDAGERAARKRVSRAAGASVERVAGVYALHHLSLLLLTRPAYLSSAIYHGILQTTITSITY